MAWAAVVLYWRMMLDFASLYSSIRFTVICLYGVWLEFTGGGFPIG